MRSNDIERAIDTTLSGLTTTDARKEQLLRAALTETHPCAPQKPEKQPSRVKLKWHFSLSFGLSHMIVAAVVIIVVMLAPALINHEKLRTTQSEDEGWYIIQDHETDQAQIAQAAYKPFRAATTCLRPWKKHSSLQADCRSRPGCPNGMNPIRSC